MRREDYFVTSADACSAETEDESVGCVANSKRVRDTKISGERILELGEVALLNKSAATEDVADDFEEFLFTRGKCPAVVEEGNRGLSESGGHVVCFGVTAAGLAPEPESYSIVAYEMYGSHSKRRKRKPLNALESSAARVSPGQIGLSSSSNATMAPFGIRGMNASSAARVGS